MTLRQYLQKKYSKSTLNSNLYNIRRFTDYYDKRAEKATYKDVLQYIEYLRKNYDLHPKTLRHRLYAIKIYFNYLLETGKRKDHPCSELYLKDKVSRQIQVDNLYSLETLENFLESYQIKQKKQLEIRNKIIISLLIYQALTVREIAGLEVENIDLEKCVIFIKVKKRALSPFGSPLKLRVCHLACSSSVSRHRQATLSVFATALHFANASFRLVATRPPPAIVWLACGSLRASAAFIVLPPLRSGYK